MFCNKAGYNFYKKNPEDVNNKKCYELILKNKRCTNCICETVMKTKKPIKTEKYFPELDMYMDLFCTPILDENNEILYIVERLKDITESKLYNDIIKEREKKYSQIINISPDAIIVVMNNKIVLANDAAYKLVNIDKNQLVGQDISKYFPQISKKIYMKKLSNILKYKVQNVILDLEHEYRNKKINLQVSSSYINYDKGPAILMMIRDITEIKKGIKQAYEFQKNTLIKQFPIPDKAFMESVYVPASDVSGDFFKIYKLSDDYIIGMLIDVSGKGVTAALSISAFEVLFYEEILISHEPIEILKHLNNKLLNCFGEKYIAACCFSLDFNKKAAKVSCAGMNQFIFMKKNSKALENVVKGPFLGMFENSEFNETTIDFDSGDRFYFFTDGLDSLVDDDKVVQRYMRKVSINDFKNYLDEYLNETIAEKGSINDDCTLLEIEIK